MNMLWTWFEICLLLQIMPLMGNWGGLEVRLVCCWLPLFPWVNSLKSLCLSFFLCKVQGLGESWLVKAKIFWDLWNTRSCADCQILDCFISFYKEITQKGNHNGATCSRGAPPAEERRELAPNLPPSCLHLPAGSRFCHGAWQSCPAWSSSQKPQWSKTIQQKNNWKCHCFLPFCTPFLPGQR